MQTVKPYSSWGFQICYSYAELCKQTMQAIFKKKKENILKQTPNLPHNYFQVITWNGLTI